MKISLSLGGGKPILKVTHDTPTETTDGVIPHFDISPASVIAVSDDAVVIRGRGWRDEDQAMVPLVIACDRDVYHDAIDAYLDAVDEADADGTQASLTGELHALRYEERAECSRLSMLIDPDVPGSKPVPCRTFDVFQFCDCVDLNFGIPEEQEEF